VDLVAGLELGNGLSGTWSYDGARRPVSVAFTGPSGQQPFAEQLGWSPRGLRTASQRADLGDTGELYATDGAGRLVTAARQRNAVAQTSANSPIFAEDLTPEASFSRYQYDAAQNLTARQVVQAAPLSEQSLPPDASSRNRPASVGSKALTWDANGNLTSKGDLSFGYDFRNRLTRVHLSGVEIASYEYDTFNRRVRVQRAQDVLREVAWSGWQELEETLGGQLWQRRTYGRGLDELVRLEGDLDLDGVLETDYAPLYDRTGNLAVLTGAQGQPVAKYAYSPFGDTMAAQVDATQSQVHQVLFKAGELWLEFSEEVLTTPFFQAVTSGEVYLQEDVSGTRHTLVALFPVDDGRQAHHRVVLTPSTAPAAGVEVALVVGQEAVRDLFDNELSEPYTLQFPWPPAGTTEQVLEDSATPEVEQVYLRDSYLEIEFSEAVDLTAATQSILVDGTPASWILGEHDYTLRTTAPLAAGTHTVEITTGPLDLSGQGLPSTFTTTASVATTPTGEQLYTRPSSTEVAFATLGNFFSYHGRPLDVDTGLLYFRNRYYDPELGRFITADPLGYVDGPSQYLFAMNSPVVYSDSLGLCFGPWSELTCGELVGSFNPASSGFWKRSGSFAGGEVLGLVKAPIHVADALIHLDETLDGVTQLSAHVVVNHDIIDYGAVAADLGNAYANASASEQGEIFGEWALFGVATTGAGPAIQGTKAARAARVAQAAQDATRARVLQNLAASRRARSASRFGEYLGAEQRALSGSVPRALPRSGPIASSVGAMSRAERLARKLKLNANSLTTRQLLNSLDDKVSDFVGQFRQGSINRELPSEVLDMTVEEALNHSSKVRKLLTDGRFVK
jgi:RHS repeat-associated protein